jgi:hypothetical protein
MGRKRPAGCWPGTVMRPTCSPSPAPALTRSGASWTCWPNTVPAKAPSMTGSARPFSGPRRCERMRPAARISPSTWPATGRALTSFTSCRGRPIWSRSRSIGRARYPATRVASSIHPRPDRGRAVEADPPPGAPPSTPQRWRGPRTGPDHLPRSCAPITRSAATPENADGFLKSVRQMVQRPSQANHGSPGAIDPAAG